MGCWLMLPKNGLTKILEKESFTTEITRSISERRYNRMRVRGACGEEIR